MYQQPLFLGSFEALGAAGFPNAGIAVASGGSLAVFFVFQVHLFEFLGFRVQGFCVSGFRV